MICLIVAIVLTIITTFICICVDWLEGLCINVAWITILIIFLIAGWSASIHTPEMEIAKEDLIENYKRCPCTYHLNEMQDYNENLNFGNNYWYRFKLVDNSQYEIDIDELLSEREKKE